MKYGIVFILLFTFNFSIAQVQIRGTVVEEFGVPISDVVVYADGTSFSVYSDENGEFKIDLTEGSYDLVFRKDGYKINSIQINHSLEDLKVVLETFETVELEDAVIHSVSKKDRERYFKIFIDEFLGRDKAAKQSKILNPKVLSFYFNADENFFSAYASEPLFIIGKTKSENKNDKNLQQCTGGFFYFFKYFYTII